MRGLPGSVARAFRKHGAGHCYCTALLLSGLAVLITWCVRSVAEIGDGVALKTMDIFAGCGGLSEGMHQARAADTRCYPAPQLLQQRPECSFV